MYLYQLMNNWNKKKRKRNQRKIKEKEASKMLHNLKDLFGNKKAKIKVMASWK